MTDKRWFIRDEAIRSHKDDVFGHLDFARQLKDKIEELPGALTIALSGLHGTGKSSIGYLLETEFTGDPNYQFVRIEAWRHEGESRRKAFLCDVVDALSRRTHPGSDEEKELEELRQGLHSTQARQTAELDLGAARNSLGIIFNELKGSSFRVAALLFVGTLFLAVVWYFATVGVAPRQALSSLWSTLPSVLSFPAVVSVTGYFATLVKQLSDKILEPAKITVTTAPPSTAEQYERSFRKAVEIAARGNGANKRLVLFVDELDRLPASEIIEALKAIRTFRDISPCVFVVSLDEDIVVHALLEVRDGTGFVEDSAAAEEFLNKFFKLRQHVPVLVSSDMREFARSVIGGNGNHSINAGIAELPAEQLDDVLDTVIHQRVKTPRHAIRLLNSFNSDYRLAKVREEGVSRLLSKGAITNHLPFLGVMVCLREDFPDFYRALTRDRELLFAIDMLLDGKKVSEVADRYPGSVSLAQTFFKTKQDQADNALVQDPDTLDADDGDTADQDQEGLTTEQTLPSAQSVPANHTLADDTLEPKDECLPLMLYLRDTARFRGPSLVPFIYYRENEAARLLGSDLHERMAESFRSNYPAAIRKMIVDGGASYSKTAALVALYCLDAWENRLPNVLRSICGVFKDMDEALQPEVAGRFALRASQSPSVLKELPPAIVLDVLAAAPDSIYRAKCVNAVLDTLDAENSDAPAVIDAVLQHDTLIDEEQEGRIANCTAELVSALPPEALPQWFDKLAGLAANDRVVTRFFGFGFMRPAVDIARALDTKSIPKSFISSFTQMYKSLTPIFLDSRPKDFIDMTSSLLTATSWGIDDLGMFTLTENAELLDKASGAKVIGMLFRGGSFPDDGADQSRHESRTHLIDHLIERYGPDVASAATDKVNKYFLGVLTSAKPDYRSMARSALKKLAAKLGHDYFQDLAIGLSKHVAANTEAEYEFEVFETLSTIADVLPNDAAQTMLTSISASLLRGEDDAGASFAADVVCAACGLEPALPLSTAAFSVADQLVPLVTPSYTPTQLQHAARVLDLAVSRLDQPAQYLQALASFFAFDAPANKRFALARMHVAESAGLVDNAMRASLSREVITGWGQMPDMADRESAARLLACWSDAIPAPVLPTFWSQQIEFLGTSFDIAWANVLPAWPRVTKDNRIRVLESVRSERIDRIASDIRTPASKLSVEAVTDLLTRLPTALDEDSARAIEAAIVESLSAEERNAVSESLFDALAQDASALSRSREIRLASYLANAINAPGFEFYCSLLKRDPAARVLAFSQIDAFLSHKTPSTEQVEEFGRILAEALASDDNDLAVRNFEIANHNGFSKQAAYAAAIKAKMDGLKGLKDPDNKRALQRFREISKGR